MERMERVLVWMPRVLAILFAVFISLFALDVFGAGHGFWESIAGFLIHMLPTALILIALAIAWRRAWAGAILFASLETAYLIMAGGQVDWVAYVLISGPAFLIGILFLISWIYRRQVRSSR